jgi:hypothetical protein
MLELPALISVLNPTLFFHKDLSFLNLNSISSYAFPDVSVGTICVLYSLLWRIYKEAKNIKISVSSSELISYILRVFFSVNDFNSFDHVFLVWLELFF